MSRLFEFEPEPKPEPKPQPESQEQTMERLAGKANEPVIKIEQMPPLEFTGLTLDAQEHLGR